MFLRPFFRYLKPHRWRLVIGVICMVGMGFFGTYNFLLAKPMLDVLFENVKISEREKELEAQKQEYESLQENLREDGKGFFEQIKDQGQVKALYFKVAGNAQLLRFYRWADQSVDNKIQALLWIGFTLVIFSLIGGLCDFGSQYELTYSLQYAVRDIQNDIFAHVMRQDMAFFAVHPVGFLMSRIGSDVKSIRALMEYLIKTLFQQIIQLSFVVSLLFVLNFKLTLMAFVGLTPAVVLIVFFARILKKVTRKQKKKTDMLSALAIESLQNIGLIKALTTEERECRKFRKQNWSIFRLEMKRRVARFASSPLMVFLGSIGLSAIMLFGGFVVLKQNTMEASEFVIYIVLLAQLYRPLKRIGNVNVTWQTAKVSAERIEEMWSFMPLVQDPPDDLPPKKVEQMQQGVTVESVHFAYHSTPVLHGVSLEIPKGSTTAIVGRSGSGKSTLANMLLRFFDPSQGAVKIDGVDIRDMRQKDLRALYGIVSQDTILFNETVANNIAYGEEGDIDMDRLQDAAKAAHAHDFIMALDGGKGYETMVGPGGSNLSGGQRQRIAIARAFYRNPQILILDEATSALDNESEAAVQEALGLLMSSRTVVVIAHRLTTIMHADNIVVLQGGRVMEQGTHTELINHGGHYASLYKVGEIAPD